MNEQTEQKTVPEMTEEERSIYSAERLKTIAIQNDKIIELLDKIRGGVQFFVVLTVIALILSACTALT